MNGYHRNPVLLYVIVFVFLFFCTFLLTRFSILAKPTWSQDLSHAVGWWKYQVIDTMKLSRDLAREKLNDPSFNLVIDRHMQNIQDTGATHVAIGTPYDEEFLPFMRRFVRSARNHGLSIWFRGNLSGWEGWFGYPKIDRVTHTKKIEEFILRHPDLFADGDIFTSCPECENGGPGDPRTTGDKEGYTQFLINDYQTTKKAFQTINKNVISNIYSMNGDVARLIMDKPTTTTLGGIITVDHYVKTPEQMKQDLINYAGQSGGRIMIGEFGLPIPDIHGNLNQDQQAELLDQFFDIFAKDPNVIGVNYWVGSGGSTELWGMDGNNKRKAADVVQKYFKPIQVKGFVVNEIGQPIPQAKVEIFPKKTVTDQNGEFILPTFQQQARASISAEGFLSQEVDLQTNSPVKIQLIYQNETFWFKLQKYFTKIFANLYFQK